MKRRRLSMRQKVALSVIAGGAFLVLALWGIEWHKLGAALGRTRLGVLAPCLLAMLAVHVWRVHRWWVLVNAAHPAPFKRIAAHCLVGYLAISTLPFRAGELIRPFLLKSKEDIPFSVGLATCIAERVFDVLGLAVMLAVLLWAGLPSEVIYVGDVEVHLRVLSRVAFAFTSAGILGIIGLIVFQKALSRIIVLVVSAVSEDLANYVAEILQAFVRGLSFLKGVVPTTYVTVSSVLIWLVTGVALWGVAQALSLEQVSIPAAEGVTAVTMIGIAIPAGPAFVGSYELFCKASLALYGVPPEDALAVAVLHHMLGFVVTVALGLFALGGVTGLVKLAKAAQAEGDRQAGHPEKQAPTRKRAS